MSVVFKLDDLDSEEQEKIDKLLTFIPEENKAMKFSRPSFFRPESTGLVKMYYTHNKQVHLPYRFACAYKQTIFNQDLKYPKIFAKREGNFSGKLLDRQTEPFKQAIEYLKEYQTVTIALYPGFGKTFIGTMLSWYLNRKTCVLVHRENVGKQWVKTFRNYFNLPEEEVVFVDNKEISDNFKVLVCMDGRVDKIKKEHKREIGTLIIDEAHCFCAPSKVKPMLSFSPKYTIAETATPVKENGMHKMIQSICGTHYIRKISNKPYKFYLIQTNLEFATEGEHNPFGQLVTKQCTSLERNQLILDILLQNQKYKTIIATSRTEHCKTLKSMIEEKGMESSELYGNKKNYKTKNILIGTGSKMGVGFDEANFCDDFDGRASDLLIICYTFASWAPFEQVRGRGMRAETPTVIMLNDQHNITKKHFRQIKKWVRETNGEVIEMNLKKFEEINFKI